MKSEEKIERLKEIISEMQRVLVAFSGGMDSTFLLKVCVDVLGRENVIAVTATSPTYQMDELEEAKNIARIFGVKHFIIQTNEMENEKFLANPVDRCYLCKKELFSKLKEIASKYRIEYVLDASNSSDALDYRPGMKAARELGIRSPLIEANITKDEIRKLSAEMNLPTASKPPQPCLASRFPYGERITEEKLEMVAKAEKFLKEMGFKVVRVRHHGKVARIEVGKDEIARLMEERMREKIYEKLREIGYTWVCLDLLGYRSGSMNEAINGVNNCKNF